MTEDEMVGGHHQLSGHEFEQTLGDGEGQGSLVCCSPQGCKESDRNERLNNNNKLKKLGKTTRPFRYDLNQIPYDYTVEVTNRFKGLDLVDKVPEELWTEICKTMPDSPVPTLQGLCDPNQTSASDKMEWLNTENSIN